MNKLLQSGDTLSAIVIGSINFKQLKKKSSFINLLERFCLDKQPYSITHNYFALQMMKLQNFTLNDKWKRIEENLISNIYEILGNNNLHPDVWIEAYCFLKYFSEIKEDDFNLRKLISMQQKDGGWKYYNDSETSNSHSTFLALWVLLSISKLH
ncbi:MAG: hypothetical protein FGM14_12170 [Flavobacteriales bacterium]|nr:hypothetical protein [Flavobacteriales bacterium]